MHVTSIRSLVLVLAVVSFSLTSCANLERSSSHRSDALYREGQELLNFGKYIAAANRFEESLKLARSSNVDAFDLTRKIDALAESYHELGKYKEAEVLYRESLSM